MKIICYCVLVFILLIPVTAWTAGKRPVSDIPGYRDLDGDGRNDLFRDANGDGINDVTGKPYQHRFQFQDGDRDGINDLFQDADGDGINDHQMGIQKTNGLSENVLDFDRDGINDVTGFQHHFEMHEKQGFDFIDEDGDGIRDAMEPMTNGRGNSMREHQKDRFRDEDGDGINDGRGFGREERQKGRHSEGGKRRGGTR